MADKIILVGVPDTGKTNYLARLWETLRKGKGRLVCPSPPDHIKYVEDALAHILQGSFAPRSNKNISESRSDVMIPVKLSASDANSETLLQVPDATGELWKKAIQTLEIPLDWMSDLRECSGAMLFLRILSDEIVAPLDWITARAILRSKVVAPATKDELPTQVQLCELLRFLEVTLKSYEDGSQPRIAIVVTAYDRLDASMASKGPTNYIRTEYPLFAGRLIDSDVIETKVFGISVVGGDLDIDDKFRNKFLDGNVADFGYVVLENSEAVVKVPDISLPVAWLLKGDIST